MLVGPDGLSSSTPRALVARSAAPASTTSSGATATTSLAAPLTPDRIERSSTADAEVATQTAATVRAAVARVTDVFRNLFSYVAPTPPGGAAPSGLGVPPQGTASGVRAPSNVATITNAPSGTLFSKNADPTGAKIFDQVSANGNTAGIEHFIDGTSAHDPRLSSDQQRYVASLTSEQRTQIAMQQLGTSGTTQYLNTLTLSAHNPRQTFFYGAPIDAPAALTTFQTGFNALVHDGSISKDDISALAADAGQRIASGQTDGAENPADFSATAELFKNLDWSDPKQQAAQNYFVGASFDSADVLRQYAPKNGGDAANFLYAQGTDVLGATSPDNQSGFAEQISATRMTGILKASLSGEAYATRVAANTNPSFVTPPAPLTGSAQLLSAVASNGYDDDGRLKMSTPEQAKVLDAYKTVMNYVTGVDKTGPNAQDLVKGDQAGSGLRSALSRVFSAGMPVIVHNAVTQTDPSTHRPGAGEGLATAFKAYSQFQLTGQGETPDEKQQIEREFGSSIGEFYGDVQAAQDAPSTVAKLDAKYGASLFIDAKNVPGYNAPSEQAGNGFRLLGNMVGGTNEGLLDVEAANQQKPESSSDSELLYGALIGTAGAAILTVAPEAAPAVLTFANGLIATGSAFSAKGVLDSEDGKDTDSSQLPSQYIGDPAKDVGGEVAFTRQIQEQVQGPETNSADQSAYATGFSLP